MRFKIYICIEGAGFDPVAWNAALVDSLKGSVLERKKLSDKSHNQRTYWESKELIPATGYPEDALLELLSRYQQVLLQLLGAGDAVKISAQIVQEHKEDESPRGFYASSQLVEVLASLRADLDLDIIAV